MDKILLGTTTSNLKDFDEGEKIFITKHSWDCSWYFGFGYIGNKNIHTHFREVFLKDVFKSVNECFSKTKITESEWWLLKDLFKQAYTLKECAEVYQYGGHMTSDCKKSYVINDRHTANLLNKDLETVLNRIWELLEEINLRR